MDRGSQLDKEDEADEEAEDEEEKEKEKEREEEEKRKAADIKSNNPHLAGGEQVNKKKDLNGFRDPSFPLHLVKAKMCHLDFLG